jgi:beta-lactamase regulating signal transducer with metallopeptidase domain
MLISKILLLTAPMMKNASHSIDVTVPQQAKRNLISRIGIKNIVLVLLIVGLTITTILLYLMYTNLKDETDPNQKDFNTVTTM